MSQRSEIDLRPETVPRGDLTEATAASRLTALAQAALALASAETPEELAAVAATAGLAALGADTTAITVALEDGRFRLTTTCARDGQSERTCTELPADSNLPAVIAIRRAEPVILPTRAAGELWSRSMTEVYESSDHQAWAFLPLVVGSRVVGSLSAGWRQEKQLGPAEVEVLTAFASQCARTLDRVQARAVEQLEADQNRQIAEALQRSLLTEPPLLDRLRLAVRYLPASSGAQVGGDWYDAFTTAAGRTLLVIGDVTGHDLRAAAAMGQIRNVLRGVANVTQATPAAVLSALDQTLASLHADTMATCAVAEVVPDPDRDTAVFSWSNAGHLPPLLVSEAGTATLLTSEADLLLGLDPAAVRRDHRVSLVAGATIVLYTDGLVERRGESLDVGLERLRLTASNLSRLPVEDLCDALLTQMGDRQLDDVALLAVRLEASRP